MGRARPAGRRGHGRSPKIPFDTIKHCDVVGRQDRLAAEEARDHRIRHCRSIGGKTLDWLSRGVSTGR